MSQPPHPEELEGLTPEGADAYRDLFAGLVDLVEKARVAATRSVNAHLTATYRLIGRRIVEHEQSGRARAGYGQELMRRLAEDLSRRLGRGFSQRNLEQMRQFYLGWSDSLHLLTVADPQAREFCEREAILGGWSVRQLDHQIASLAYQRTAGQRALAQHGETPDPNEEV